MPLGEGVAGERGMGNRGDQSPKAALLPTASLTLLQDSETSHLSLPTNEQDDSPRNRRCQPRAGSKQKPAGTFLGNLSFAILTGGQIHVSWRNHTLAC